MRVLFSDRDSARANLAEAELIYERTRKNFEQRIVPQQVADRAGQVAGLVLGGGHLPPGLDERQAELDEVEPFDRRGTRDAREPDGRARRS